MLITGKPDISVQGFPVGFILLVLGIAGWTPFYILSALRNIIAFAENNPGVAVAVAVVLGALLIFGDSSAVPLSNL